MAQDLGGLARLIRAYILESTTKAGSGHPSSSLSAVELMTTLVFGGFFRFDPTRPQDAHNDRLIFSKGHASPLLYAVWTAAGQITTQELMTLRKFSSRLEGHPSIRFPFTEIPTGSLGQGLSIGVGLALNAKYLDRLPYRTFVLLGDSEMSEGSNYEALQVAGYYKLNNLVGVLDVNRLGQRGETMLGHDVYTYAKRVRSFGWETVVVDGHNLRQIRKAFTRAMQVKQQPVMIIAKTLKGKGVSVMENKLDWHGKPLKPEQLPQALAELGPVNRHVRGLLAAPEAKKPFVLRAGKKKLMRTYPKGSLMATRHAYGYALQRLGASVPELVVLDAETSNSTYEDLFKDTYPDRFFEMFIAEQNMLSVAVGLASRGKIPFASTFAAFFSRAYDQIRMSQYARANIKLCGTHCGVSVGEDGPSQMGLEDIALFRSLMDSVVLYPGDAVATEKLVEAAVRHQGLVYLRTTRKDTPVIYGPRETFKIGGSKVVKSSAQDQVTVIAAGITLIEALKAYEELRKIDIHIRVIDLYSIKPIDTKTLLQAADETRALITVEDHYPSGGIGEAVSSALGEHQVSMYRMAVNKMPRSGSPEELLRYEGIDSQAIQHIVRRVLTKRI